MAELFRLDQSRYLVPSGPLPQRMANSQGTGIPLVGRGSFAADLIRFAPGQGVGKHTHPGEHILIVVSGHGLLTCGDDFLSLVPGMIYHVPAGAPHALSATDAELTLISVANDHRPVDSPQRLEVLADG